MNTISPKVIASTMLTIIVTGLVASLNAITPEMFEWAGDYKALILVGLAAVATAIGGYLKGDPLRGVPTDTLTVQDVFGEEATDVAAMEPDEDIVEVDLEEVEGVEGDEPEHLAD